MESSYPPCCVRVYVKDRQTDWRGREGSRKKTSIYVLSRQRRVDGREGNSGKARYEVRKRLGRKEVG